MSSVRDSDHVHPATTPVTAEGSTASGALEAGANSSADVTHLRIRADGAASQPTQLVRRMIEILLSAAALAVLSPVMIFIAALTKASSRGPVLFVQERVGRGGAVFTMYKFRSMHIGAEDETGPIWSKKNDPRCTALGGFLRRWSLDELPQLLNVLRGDMSIIGPRPERPYFVERFSTLLPEYPLRHLVSPGITGWAQVNGWRGDTSLEDRLNCDLYYVRHRTIWLELYILLLTPISVLSTKNAH